MNKEKQRVAIAKACGWSCFEPDTIQYTARRSDGKWGEIPDYTNDLNAMHEAEETLDEQERKEYYKELYEFAPRRVFTTHQDNWVMIHLTASQRAEAFLKTLNLWESK